MATDLFLIFHRWRRSFSYLKLKQTLTPGKMFLLFFGRISPQGDNNTTSVDMGRKFFELIIREGFIDLYK